MGASNSSSADNRSMRSTASSASLASLSSARSAAPLLSPKAAAAATERVRLRIQAFRERAATQDICAQVLASWTAERERVRKTWRDMTDPARRALVMNAREKVVSRGRVLHAVVAPRALSAYNKNKIVRKLMEKCCFELFDISVLYGAESLPSLVEDVLRRRGGGNEIPVGLLVEVNNTFEPECTREHSGTLFSEHLGISSDAEDAESPGTTASDPPNFMLADADVDADEGHSAVSAVTQGSAASPAVTPRSAETMSSNSNSSSAPVASSTDSPTAAAAAAAAPASVAPAPAPAPAAKPAAATAAARPPQPSIDLVDADGNRSAVLIDSASVNSLQGYYSRDRVRQARRKSASKSIRNLLAFVPEGLDAVTRRNLALELLLEMRHAFLVHFAVLVFSELFDDEQRVLRKYEYDSDSETDGGLSETDCEEEDDDAESDDAAAAQP